MDYHHVVVESDFDLELSAYERHELRRAQRSSTDGQPIARLKPPALEALLRQEHGEPWSPYMRAGELTGLNALLEDNAQPVTMAEAEALGVGPSRNGCWEFGVDVNVGAGVLSDDEPR